MKSQHPRTIPPDPSTVGSEQALVTPQLRSLESLDESLTQTRRKVANEILLWFNRSPERDDRRHALVVGPPGSGKSHILSYLQKIITRYHASAHTIVVQEETRSILSLFDFIISCLRYCETISPETIVDTLKSRSPEPLVAIKRLFDEYTTGQPTAIFIEDFSDLFDNMDHADRNEMLAFFNERPHVKLIASSACALEEKQAVLGTMSGMFNLRRLPELSMEEASSFLGRLLFDEKELPPGLVPIFQTVHHLTGGNPGLMESIGRFLANFDKHDLDSVFAPLATTVLIPYYDRRLKQLGPDHMTILRELAHRLGQAMTLDELAANISMSPEHLEVQLRWLHRQDILTRTAVGRETYFDIHEPLFRFFLLYGDHTVESLGPLSQFVAAWFEVERQKNAFRLPRQEVDAARLEEGVSLFESGSTNEALDIFAETLAVERSNPTAGSYVFRHKLKDDPDDAFAYLGDLLSAKPLELSHPVELMENLLDFFEAESPHQDEILNVYQHHHTYIIQSFIHRFLSEKDSNNRHVLGDARIIADLLALHVPVIGLLIELVRQYRVGRKGWENAMLHIPLELRKLLLKPAARPGTIY